MKAVLTLYLAGFLIFSGTVLARDSDHPIASWSFDESDGTLIHDSNGNADGNVTGLFRRVDGVSGKALRFDGYTTGVLCNAKNLPAIGQTFSVEAWIVVGAYPWNWVPILEQKTEAQSGYSFGIDAFGHVGLKAVVDGGWQTALSTAQLPLRKWAHIAATFDPSGGLTTYIDGKMVAQVGVRGKLDLASRDDIRIGRIASPLLPAQWIHPKYPVMYSLDGLLDEVRLYNRCLTPDQIAKDFESAHVTREQVLPWPVLPSGPPGAGPFGAYYTHLKYEDIWDIPRRVGPDSDVVVRFDQSPIRLVFWQGTNYIPAWVTENGKWYTDEFLETGGAEDCPGGEDCEPMSDKQNRYSHVRVLQSNDARAVVHWRYALTEAEHYGLANVDPYTGWSDWADEYYVIYPDGSAVRKQVLWTSNFKRWHEFQETIVINQPGTRPEDNISDDALTLANMNGETATYTWPRSVKQLEKPANPNIQIVNLKSEWKPFQIVNPNKSYMTAYTGEKTYSLFEWWNHWPVAQIVSSGISAVAPDRASHSSLSHIYWEPYAQTSDSMTKIMLHGLTNGQPAGLVQLARSWISPPKVDLRGSDYKSEGYDPTQRAYVFTQTNAGRELSFAVDAESNSPLSDPVVVIKNWGQDEAGLRIDGHQVPWSADARHGYEETLAGTDLVIWMKLQSAKTVRFELIRTSR
jgi:hypothetical protein